MSARSILLASLSAALSALGCGATVTSRDAGADVSTVDAGADVPMADANVDGATVDSGDLCAERQRSLAARLLSPAEGRLTCSVVVRLGQATLRPIGFQPFCGRYATTSDAQAAALAEGAMIPYATLRMVNRPMPEDAFVFYASPADFGGVVAVSARLGLTVFAASVVWAGRGDILFPTAWQDPSALGDGCGRGGGIPRAHGYDLGAGTDLATATVDRVIGAVARTALPAALAQGGTVFDAVVLPYERSSGGAVDEGAEWIVVVHGGWLE
jgi:hypothetical protein